nr:hypothetical protein [uncultured Pseudomonas sp.]
MAEIISNVPRVCAFITLGFLAVDIAVPQTAARGRVRQIELYNELMTTIMNTPTQSVNSQSDDLKNK